MFQIFLVLLVASIVTNNPVSGLIRSEDWHADIYDFIVGIASFQHNSIIDYRFM